MKVLFEDNHLIIVEKPPNVPSQSDPSGDKDLCTMVEEHIKKRDQLSRCTLYVVHRLDRPVGGIITYAKTKKAADQFTKLIQDRALSKTYLCVACGIPSMEESRLTHHLKKKAGQNVSIAVHKNNEGAKEAILSYKALGSVQVKRDSLTLMQVKLETGRHHQIRVQLSTEGLPLWGDAKYHPQAKRKRNWTQIALWSYELSFVHPVTQKNITLHSMPPTTEPWTQFSKLLDLMN